METSRINFGKRIEMMILPARKSVYGMIVNAMADAYTELGTDINVARLEHPDLNVTFTHPVAGISPETLIKITQNVGMMEEWIGSLPENEQFRMVLEFLAYRQLQMHFLKEKCPRAFVKWEPQDDVEIRRLYDEGLPWDVIATEVGRNVNAVKLRLVRLGVDLGADTPRARFSN